MANFDTHVCITLSSGLVNDKKMEGNGLQKWTERDKISPIANFETGVISKSQ